MTGAVRAVLFDLDDTLLDGDLAWRSGMERLLARCPGVDRVAACQVWDEACREHFPRYLAGELTFDGSRVARIRSWADQMEITVEPGTELSWFETYRAGYEAGWAAFGDVAACLRELAGLRLGVVTNGDGDQQRAKLAAIGLGGAFHSVIVSGDAGCAKPDPRIFHLAAAELGLPPGQCLFVGDRRDIDALGALAAGMRAVWLNRKRSEAPDALVGQITSLAELPAFLLTSSPSIGGADVTPPRGSGKV
ncbi:MAG: HAD family hydrolase [Gemmatimonadota bacterium]